MVIFRLLQGVAIDIDPLYLVIRLRKNPISSAASKAEFTGIAGLQYLPCCGF